MYLKKVIILCGIFILLTSCTKQPGPDVLITLNSKNYTILDFFEDNSKTNFIKQPESSKKKTIQSWVDNKILLLDANNSKTLEEDESVNKQLESFEKDLKIRQYLDRTILDSIVTKEYLQDLHKKSSLQIKASHILLSYNKVNKDIDRTKEESLALAKKLVKLIKSGSSFEMLSKKHSDDKGSAETGDLGFFGWGKMVGPFQEKAFSMKPGELSEPVETQFGYHIIKVTDMKRQNTKTFEEEKTRLRQLGIRDKRDQLQASYGERIKQLKKEYNFIINNDNIKKVLNSYKTKKSEITETNVKNVQPIMVLEKIDQNIILASYNDKTINVKSLIGELKKNQRIGENFTNPEIMVKIIENAAMMDLFVLEFHKSGLETNEEYLQSIKTNKEKNLVKAYKDKKINEMVEVTEEDIKKYYDEKKETEYMNPQKSEVTEIYFENKNDADNVLKEVLEDKDNFQSYADEHTKRFNTKERKGYLGFISENQYGDLGKIAIRTPKNTIHPDIINSGKGFSIILVEDKKEATPKDISQVKNKIKSILTSKSKKDVENQLFKSLYKKYKLKIYWDCVNISE